MNNCSGVRHLNVLLNNFITRLRHWRSGVRMGERTKSLLCILGLALLPFGVFWEVATFREIPFMGDIIDYYYPIQYLITQQLRQGDVPVWNNRLFSGMPLMAHSGALYPFNLLSILMPAWMTMTYSLLIHFSLAGVFTYLYTRALGICRKGAVVAGCVFMFCGFSMAHLGHHNINRTVPWLPLILWAVERWRQRFELKYIGLGALATGLMFLGGHPQIPVYSMGIVAAYLLFFTLFSNEPDQRWRIALGGGAMVGLGLLIASPLLWNLYEMSLTYIRPIQVGSGYDFFTGMSLPPQYLLSLIFPILFRRDIALVEMTGYVGILPLVLATLAAFHWKKRVRGFWLIAAGLSLLLVLGRYTPLYRLMYHIPVYNAFRTPARNWFEFDFALAVLAGAGFDRLVSAQNTVGHQLSGWVRGIATGLVILCILILASAAWFFPGRLQQILTRNAVAGWNDPAVCLPLVLILTSSLILSIIVSRAKHRFSFVLVTALIVTDLHFSFADIIFASHSTRQPPSRVFAEALDQRPGSVDFLKQDPSFYRVLSYSPVLKSDLDERYSLISTNLNLLFDIDSADAYNGGMAPAQYVTFSDDSFTGDAYGVLIHPHLFRPDHNAILSLLNVKYILVPVDIDLSRWGSVSVDGIALEAFPYPTLELGSSSGLLSTTLDLPAYPVTTFAIASSVSDGMTLTDGQSVARVTVRDQDDCVSTYYLTAGQHTAEQTYDCNATAMNHQKAPIAYDLPGGVSCLYHTYFARLELGSKPVILSHVTLEYLPETGHLNVDKVSLYNAQTQVSYSVSVSQGYLAYLSEGEMYQQVYEDEFVGIYRNTKVLPRAFLVPQVKFVRGVEGAVQVVHQGVFSDGGAFAPTEVALVEAPLPAFPPAGGAITLHAYPVEPEFWTVVQWQDVQGGWHDVEGWQRTFDQENQVAWWVAPGDLGKGPFRWAVYQSQGGQLLATSDPFYLPGSIDKGVRIEMPLLWPNNTQGNSGDAEAGGRMEATVISAQAGRIEIKTSAKQNAFLVYSENYTPDWSARVDDQPVTIYRTDGALLGVPVPAGEHHAVLRYRPVSLYLALMGYSVILLIILGLLLKPMRKLLRVIQSGVFQASREPPAG